MIVNLTTSESAKCHCRTDHDSNELIIILVCTFHVEVEGHVESEGGFPECLEQTSVVVNISSCDFYNNIAANAGALRLLGEVSVENTNFVHNSAAGDGGAILLATGANLQVHNCSASAGLADNGGVLFMRAQSLSNITHSNFHDCQAVNGACVYVDALVTGTVFEDVFCDGTCGHAKQRGGFIYVGSASTVSMLSCEVKSSSADQYGGFAFLESDAELSLDSSSVWSFSTNNGGGMRFLL